ncbi:MAG: ParB/RepB/Spo0J family partition protein, partial [Acidimicrobiia bacterium]
NSGGAMAARKSGLGRGLDALIPVDHPEQGFDSLPLDRIVPNPDQPRRYFDEAALEDLANSIKEVGVLQPVVVRPADDQGNYALVAGERRCRAARLAGLEAMPAVIREGRETSDALADALIENVQREDLNPLEEAAGYRQLLEDFDMTHEAVAGRVGMSRTAVTNTVRLLQLPPEIQGMIASGELSAGHGRALLGLEDQAYAVRVGAEASEEGWSVRQVEEAVRERSADKPAPAKSRGGRVRPAAIIELEERLADHLDTRVNITYGSKGGKLVVNYASLDDLERIYRQFFSG